MEPRDDDHPFALELVSEDEADQRPDRRRECDEGRVDEAGRDGHALLDEQRRHPVREAVESDRLENVEDDHQGRAAADSRHPHVAKRIAVETGSAAAGGGSGRPYSVSTSASSSVINRSASPSRPFLASQRGLSGRPRRKKTTDTALIAYRVAEDRRMFVPLAISCDGAFLTHSQALVRIPAGEKVKKFLPRYDRGDLLLHPDNVISVAPQDNEDWVTEIRRQRLRSHRSCL